MRSSPPRLRLRLALALAATLAWGVAGTAHAGPRDDIKASYGAAKQQFNDLDLDPALATLDAAVAKADGAGLANDPMLGPLHVLRGGIIFSNTGNRSQTIAAFKQAVAVDHNVQLPIELRSPDLVKLLEEARRSVPRAATDPVVHTPPTYAAGQDLEITGLANIPLPEGAQMVLYWRKKGDTGEFTGATMDVFGNFGSATISAAEHADAGVEYFLYVFDSRQAAIANRGDKERPLVLDAPEGGGTVADGGGKPGKDKPGKDKPDRKKPQGKSKLPRVFINLGIGTGFGIARGTAEQTYQQFTPGPGSTSYGAREQACAIERWYAAEAPLAKDQATFGNHLSAVAMIGPSVLPTDQGTLTAAYDPSYCSQRHPVTTGMASAPLHIVPEVGVRVGRRVVLSLYSRLQVVTGSRVYTEDPNKQATQSFNLDVRNGMPAGFRRKPDFSWTIGVKAKYMFGKEDKKFRLYAGGFAGYGFARLRVNMGFSNDRNGNSVPDTIESGLSGPLDSEGRVSQETCVPVWPYNAGCQTDAVGDSDRALADQVRVSTKASDSRIDTVRIGPGFIGGLFGFHYQIVKYFGVYAELNVGGWFPATSSLLFDVNLGPVLTF